MSVIINFGNKIVEEECENCDKKATELIIDYLKEVKHIWFDEHSKLWMCNDIKIMFESIGSKCVPTIQYIDHDVAIEVTIYSLTSLIHDGIVRLYYEHTHKGFIRKECICESCDGDRAGIIIDPKSERKFAYMIHKFEYNQRAEMKYHPYSPCERSSIDCSNDTYENLMIKKETHMVIEIIIIVDGHFYNIY